MCYVCKAVSTRRAKRGFMGLMALEGGFPRPSVNPGVGLSFGRNLLPLLLQLALASLP